MANFAKFAEAVKARFVQLEARGLFKVDLSKDEIWDAYMAAFPAGTNEMFRERREYDCNTCKQFLRTAGGAVAIGDNGELLSIWEVDAEGYYQEVADKMAALVKSAQIRGKFYHYENRVGMKETRNLSDVGDKVEVYNHFYAPLTNSSVKRKDDIATQLGRERANKDVLLRTLEEITLDSAETVLELIAQNSLYRGEEHKRTIELFVRLKRAFDKADNKDTFAWVESQKLGEASKIRNTVIGTLLSDLSEGQDLEKAVKSFESKVAPTNYKRPTALVTPAMIKKAQEKVEELGLIDALPRRFAVATDLNITNVLFADRSVKPAMNVFEELAQGTGVKAKDFGKVEEIGIEDFLTKVLPSAESLEVLVENGHTGNLMSLIAPQHADAPNLMKWGNKFSWSYNGDVTDSIKERVKSAGGCVEGALRVSLAWSNPDDLDLHMRTPDGHHIYYGNKRGGGAELDLDMNGMDKHDAHNPVENIIFVSEGKIKEGVYTVWVNQFSRRSGDRVGFTVQLDHKGTQFDFNHPKEHRHGDVHVVKFNYSRKDGIKIIESMPHTKQSKEVWGVTTEKFQKVSMVMNSPNHWDGEKTGNKHVFFILQGCKNPDAARGFYNEYLRGDLEEHRKVFELLGSKMKVEPSDDQLSGVGFSSTNRNKVVVKVTGKVARTLKVVF
ncbi:hypothetical protein KASHIRA_00140 [Serratia phage vB_SmaM-Kashira]|nr:hypothetical protein KASHIRA_00140 [Serratia phage vB_SmaM-Kashira]